MTALSLLLCFASSARGQGTVTVTDPAALQSTNGNKVVVGSPMGDGSGGTLHMVYAEGGDIYYRRSANGNNWQQATRLNDSLSNCDQPVISVDAEDTVSVCFTCTGAYTTVYYTAKPIGSGTSWRSPPWVVERATSDPSMVSYGTDVHIAFTKKGRDIEYVTFPAKSFPWTFAGNPESAAPGVGCGTARSYSPSIAVAHAGNAVLPRVLIAFHRTVDFTTATQTCKDGETNNGRQLVQSAVQVIERDNSSSGVWNLIPLSQVGDYQDAPDSLSTAWGTTSMASNRRGDLFLAYSHTFKGNHRTDLARFDRLSGTWTKYPLGTFLANIDIATPERSLKDEVRVVYQQFPDLSSLSTCRPIEQIDMNWSAASSNAAAPTINHISTPTTSGRDPQAVFFRRNSLCGRTQCTIECVAVDCTTSAPGIRTFPSCSDNGLLLDLDFDRPGDEGYDASGNDHHGTVGPLATVHPGVRGQALGFQPNNALEFSVPPHHSDLELLKEMTGIAWVNPVGTHSVGGCPGGTVFAKMGCYWLRLNQTNSELVFQNESGSDVVSISVQIPLNKWTQVAVVRDATGKNVQFFVNGTLRPPGKTLLNAPLPTASYLPSDYREHGDSGGLRIQRHDRRGQDLRGSVESRRNPQ